MGSGTLVGIGLGECSSDEEKYKWRKASQKEYDRTPNDLRRVKFGKVWNENQRCMVEGEINQVRAEPADIANTVLKMAKKRAQVDLTLTALAAGDVFDQPSAPEPAMKMSDEPKGNPRHQQPDIPPGFDAAHDAGADGELNLGFIRTAMASSGLRDVDLWAAVDVSAWNEIKDNKLRQAAVWIEQNSP